MINALRDGKLETATNLLRKHLEYHKTEGVTPPSSMNLQCIAFSPREL